MDSITFWVVFCLAFITLYRLLSRRFVTPKARVAAMLRRYHAFEGSGLSERECLLKLLATRSGWKNLPQRFVEEIVARLGSKDDVMRFVSVSEDYGYTREHFPAIAAHPDMAVAMPEIACLFAKFGHQLQRSGRLKEAEFVQRLALRLEPNEYFTILPLAATYCEAGRYADALPLFERGLAQFESAAEGIDKEQPFPPAKCLGPAADGRKLTDGYRKMYDACLKAAKGKALPNISLLAMLSGFC